MRRRMMYGQGAAPQPMPTQGLIVHCPMASKTALDESGNPITYADDLPAGAFTTMGGIPCFTTYGYTLLQIPCYCTYASPETGYTLSTWFFPISAVGANNDRIMYDGNHPNYSIWLRGTEARICNVKLYSSFPYIQNQWNYTALSFDFETGRSKVYLNDQVLYDGVVSVIPTGIGRLSFGAYGRSGQDSYGNAPYYIASSRVYNRVLSDTEIEILATEH